MMPARSPNMKSGLAAGDDAVEVLALPGRRAAAVVATTLERHRPVTDEHLTAGPACRPASSSGSGAEASSPASSRPPPRASRALTSSPAARPSMDFGVAFDVVA